MLEAIIRFSLRHKLLVGLFTAFLIGFGLFSLSQLSIGAVPDITNNQVQIITTTRNLSTQDVEKFLTYPVELEMANLPGVKEIRSVSKFGLSVVTVVFEDDMGSYLPRQLIAEKLKNAEEKIPAGFGTPFMGPISTGLGEIYQYTLEVDPAYADQYSITDLRSIQDWLIKRKLSGIPGVVEVNTWGGYLKQYEVALNPEKLRSLNLSLQEVYQALASNNQVAGGGYIEKANESYFIRSEGLVSSLDDIRNIVVTRRKGTPIYMHNVAEVGFGHATRFGAITGNGDGEKVLGQVMMLKGASSKEVIENVKERIAAISASLPPGVTINPFLERSELIAKTTHTIAENLILGCLIVIFVVVLLLGNWRSGLVVASVIPLCLLFALSMMYLFDIDANLMSLGAIDFGIIIDGAVIIVEFIAYQLSQSQGELLGLPRAEKRKLMDRISLKGASNMMHSAVFGQLIIILVFIPILSLSGIEGKMFRPMAMVFCFALIGAMLLCFTYVPVASSLFLKPTNTHKKNISSRLIQQLQNWYTPSLAFALNHKRLVLGLALACLFGAGLLFSRMGGEFVPTLDEGDFVIQPVLKTGTSLSKTIETTTRIENILLEFPEVEQAVSRIGAAEVPTDPMSMEESDVIIKLKPKSEWQTAETKDELAAKFKEALSEIPGISYEFTQPIEMRFNELITGVRSDLAIKIFGEDLDQLHSLALETQQAIQGVEGAEDITVEKVAGLPQMSVVYNRAKIARYGLSVDELNKLVLMGFAGLPAGTVFEGEKQFDLVVRLQEAYRQNIQHLQNISLPLANGKQLPLKEVAEVSFTEGPAKISRDNTERRIVVGINVRNRDLESVVQDVQSIIEQQINLPTGYTITYGGQFENLRNARQRLLIAVPIALLLIFLLLYFAFDSIKDALMIFSAIPLAAVGGVLLLFIRGMPFSISAGVGFIALFGIAVLNGIVLIEAFKKLKKEGVTDVYEQVRIGTSQRLRPVLLTATAAAFGFLPMALSQSAGAEVQRPLATVVVGGLITATLLTLMVLPVLYVLIEENRLQLNKKLAKRAAAAILLLGLPLLGEAQDTLSLDDALQLAHSHNAHLQAQQLAISRSEQLKGTAFNLDKTQLYYAYDQNNIAPNGLPLKIWGLSQQLEFPTYYLKRKQLLEAKSIQQQQAYTLAVKQLDRQVAQAYYSLLYWQNKQSRLAYIDSLYTRFATAAKRRYTVGETNYLETLTAESKREDIRLQLQQASQQKEIVRLELAALLQTERDFVVPEQTLSRLEFPDADAPFQAALQYQQAGITVADKHMQVEKQNLMPGLALEYFQGTNQGEQANTYQGFQLGLAIPLWFGAQSASVRAARLESALVRKQAENYKQQLLSEYEQLQARVKQHEEALAYYQATGKRLATEILHAASKGYEQGEIDYFQYIQALENARTIELTYLDNLHQYNLAVLNLYYFTL